MIKTSKYPLSVLILLLSLLLSTQANALSRSTNYHWYDSGPQQGLLQSIDGPRTDVQDITTLDYDSQGNLKRLTNALGHMTEITTHDTSGRPLEIIDANGLHTTLSYDPRGRLLQTRIYTDSTTSDIRTTTYRYTPAGDLAQIILPTGDTLNYTWDDARRLIQLADAQDNRIVYDVDLMGNILSRTLYNNVGTLVQQHNALYNQLGQLFQSIGASQQVSEYQYDANGNNTQILDPLGNATRRAFDPLNRLKQIIDPHGGNTALSYDNAGNLNQITDPNGHTTTYSYDGLGNLTRISSPDTGITTYETYDSAGNVLQQHDARGVITSYQYDALNRLTTINTPDSHDRIHYFYDGSHYPSNLPEPPNHAPIGRRTAMQDSNGSSYWYYNAQGDIIQSTRQASNGTIWTNTWQYHNRTGLLTRSTRSDGLVLNYQYNTNGQLNRIDLQANGLSQTLVSNIQYQPFAGIKALDYGNGLRLSRDFDLDGRLSQQQVSGNDRLQDLSWDYNPNSSVQNLNNLLNSTLSQNFAYDELDRLTEAQSNGSAYTYLGFNYDANSNRVQQDADNQRTDYLINTSSNHLQGSSGALIQDMQYDARGNLIRKDQNGVSWQYQYNDHNRLTQLSKNGQWLARYQYNGLGQRIEKSLSDGSLTYYLYNPSGQLISEADSSGHITRQLIWLDGEPLALTEESQQMPFERILDNRSRHVSYTGQWQASTAIAGYTGSDYQYHASQSQSDTARIIDNDSADFSTTGQWTSSTAVTGYQGADYVHHYANGVSPQAALYDNSSGQSTGNWPASTSVSGYQGHNYQYHRAGQGDNHFSWSIPAEPRSYNVYTRWTSHPNRATNAPYTITHASGSTTVRVNQQQNGGTWHLLGTYTLDNNSRVTLTDQADGYVIADAIRVEPADARPNSATWVLNAAGQQQVYARWSAHPNRATDAPYTITHANGTTTVRVNQQQNGGTWHLLGTFTLDNNSRVTLTDQADGYVIADAIALQNQDTANGNTATWSALVDTAGTYELQARWSAHPNRATDAPYTISHAHGTTTVRLNQQTRGG